jgi:hypothetical protein
MSVLQAALPGSYYYPYFHKGSMGLDKQSGLTGQRSRNQKITQFETQTWVDLDPTLMPLGKLMFTMFCSRQICAKSFYTHYLVQSSSTLGTGGSWYLANKLQQQLRGYLQAVLLASRSSSPHTHSPS